MYLHFEIVVYVCFARVSVRYLKISFCLCFVFSENNGFPCLTREWVWSYNEACKNSDSSTVTIQASDLMCCATKIVHILFSHFMWIQGSLFMHLFPDRKRAICWQTFWHYRVRILSGRSTFTYFGGQLKSLLWYSKWKVCYLPPRKGRYSPQCH